MSRETVEWFSNGNILVGDIDLNGLPWWADWAGASVDSPFFYPGAIPVSDVESKLFNWTADEAPVIVRVPASPENATGMDDDGNPYQDVVLPDRKAIVASDTGHVFGIFKSGYQPHQFGDVLLQNVSNLIDDTVHIQSAGLLKSRAVAWVQIGIPDTMTTPEGVDYRPRLIATTGHDGTVATTYKKVSTIVVCDNTRDMAMSEKGDAFKIKRTKYSHFKLADARAALELVHTVSDDFAAEVKALCEQEVTDQQFRTLVETLVPITDQTAKAGITKAETKRDQLNNLWVNDRRAATWRGTAFGALQAFNTWSQHDRGVRGGTVRIERTMMDTINGDVAKDDSAVLEALGKILASA